MIKTNFEGVKGYTMHFKKKDVFFQTNRKNKTIELCKEIASVLLNISIEEVTEDTAKFVQQHIDRAEYAEKEINGRKYAEITGKNFGGYGDFYDDYIYSKPLYRLSK